MSGLIKNIVELIIQHVGTIEELEREHKARIERICVKHGLDPCAECNTLITNGYQIECDDCGAFVCDECIYSTENGYFCETCVY